MIRAAQDIENNAAAIDSVVDSCPSANFGTRVCTMCASRPISWVTMRARCLWQR